jgi:hypothetical protein
MAHKERPLAYHICQNGPAGDWYWEVSYCGDIVARSLAPTREQARADAIKAAASYVERTLEGPGLMRVAARWPDKGRESGR